MSGLLVIDDLIFDPDLSLNDGDLALREIYEVWAGSEGFKPETAPEAYQARLITKMASIASGALNRIQGEDYE